MAAQTPQLVFLLANQRMRHAAVHAVTSRVNSNPDLVTQFNRKLAQPAFKAHLERAAKKGEDGKTRDVAAEDAVRRDLEHFISIPGSSVPFGPIAHNAALRQLYAMTYRFGWDVSQSVFLTVSPDDKSNALAFRMCFVSKSEGKFPATATPELLRQFATSTGAGVLDGISVDFSNASLSKLMASNPIAASEAFYSVANAILADHSVPQGVRGESQRSPGCSVCGRARPRGSPQPARKGRTRRGA